MCREVVKPKSREVQRPDLSVETQAAEDRTRIETTGAFAARIKKKRSAARAMKRDTYGTPTMAILSLCPLPGGRKGASYR